MSFLEDTRVTAIAEGHYQGRIASGWDIAGNANGGYLLGIVARALQAHSGRPDPVTVSAHFLRPGRPGPVEVHCETVKEGKRFATMQAQLRTEGKPALQVLAAYSDLSQPSSAPEKVAAAPPDLPPLEQCVSGRDDGDNGAPFAFGERVDLRLHPDDAGFRTGNPSGHMCIRGWFRLPDDEPIDTLALLLAADSFPPNIFNADLPRGWAPTVELTVHVRARPQPGWLRARFTTRFVTGGFLEEDGELWDASGHLVAQSRQLGLVPRPESAGQSGA